MNIMTFGSACNILVDTGKRCYEKNYISGSEGNLSVRLNPTEIATTPTGVCKGTMNPDDMVRIDIHGNKISGKAHASSEIKLHLEYYRLRPDIACIIHAHPVHSLALMLARIPMTRPYVPEMVALLGAIPTARYAAPSTSQVPESIRPYASQTDIILLDRHGVVIAGRTLNEAFNKLEILEHGAEAILKAHQASTTPLPTLTPDEVDTLVELRSSAYHLSGAFLDEYEFIS